MKFVTADSPTFFHSALAWAQADPLQVVGVAALSAVVLYWMIEGKAS